MKKVIMLSYLFNKFIMELLDKIKDDPSSELLPQNMEQKFDCFCSFIRNVAAWDYKNNPEELKAELKNLGLTNLFWINIKERNGENECELCFCGKNSPKDNIRNFLKAFWLFETWSKKSETYYRKALTLTSFLNHFNFKGKYNEIKTVLWELRPSRWVVETIQITWNKVFFSVKPKK